MPVSRLRPFVRSGEFVSDVGVGFYSPEAIGALVGAHPELLPDGFGEGNPHEQ